VLSLICSLADGASLPNPIAPAAEGQKQCYKPDTARKTCQSLAAYKNMPNGQIENTAIVLISSQPAIVMTTISPVSIKAGQVCGYIQSNDIATADFSVAGQPATTAQTKTLQQQLQIGMKSIFGHEICTTYTPEGGTFLAKATVDGVPQPTMQQEVIWVRPDEGYKASP
jgi:hypothetical protein